MKTTYLMIPILLAAAAASAIQFPATTSPENSTPPQTPTAAPAHTWTNEQIVTASVREAWTLGGRTPEGFLEIVRALTALSAQKRGVTLPDSQTDGARAGEWIKKQARKDPDQLLYVIVDQAVQHSGKSSRTSSQQ